MEFDRVRFIHLLLICVVSLSNVTGWIVDCALDQSNYHLTILFANYKSLLEALNSTLVAIIIGGLDVGCAHEPFTLASVMLWTRWPKPFLDIWNYSRFLNKWSGFLFHQIYDCRQEVILDLGISGATTESSAIDARNPGVSSAALMTADFSIVSSLRRTALASPLSGFWFGSPGIIREVVGVSKVGLIVFVSLDASFARRIWKKIDDH